MSDKPDPAKLAQAVDAIFAKYDTSRRGFLGKQEVALIIRDVFSSIGRTSPVSDLEISQFMTYMDRDGDGKINKKELIDCFTFMVNH